MLRGPVSSSSTHAVSAPADGSTVATPPSVACRTTAVMVRAESTMLCGTLEIRFAPCVGCTNIRFGNPRTWMPCSVGIPSAQDPDSVPPPRPPPAAAGHLEAGPPGVRGTDLEAGAVDDAVQLVLPAGRDHAGLGDPLDPLAVRVDQVGVRVVEGLQVLVVEARPLAQLAVPGLELARDGRIPHDGVGSGADLLHLLEVGLLVGGEHGRRVQVLPRKPGDPGADPPGDVGPAVLYQVHVRVPAGLVGGEVLQ